MTFKKTEPQHIQALLDAAAIGLYVQTLHDLRGMAEEEVSGLLAECDQHEAAGTFIPMYPPFLRKMLELLTDAGLVRKRETEEV